VFGCLVNRLNVRAGSNLIALAVAVGLASQVIDVVVFMRLP
jgi:hypothetical protein